jgi:hypothetical protein
VACPYFVPLEIVNDGSWPHPSRLPLGAGWTGNCRASGQEIAASDTHIREFCNLGYATACPHLPPRRDWDAVRFSIVRAGREQVTIGFVCELAHAPIEMENSPSTSRTNRGSSHIPTRVCFAWRLAISKVIAPGKLCSHLIL